MAKKTCGSSAGAKALKKIKMLVDQMRFDMAVFGTATIDLKKLKAEIKKIGGIPCPRHFGVRCAQHDGKKKR